MAPAKWLTRQAGELCAGETPATADATALARGADVLGCDQHLARLLGVRFIAKPAR
jgi:hypothetical protein